MPILKTSNGTETKSNEMETESSKTETKSDETGNKVAKRTLRYANFNKQ